mmetsp:Transcript_15624/g.19665  ORF Transcript_15624/g.19665 Transcript_15624/m.19665 type:complete len:80 (+) Transcript_15624:2436-2675(+)
MGITKAQGARVYFYEAYMVVVAASILGIASGFSAALLINSQLYMILEFPLAVQFPWILLLIMMVIAILTTFVAVYIPIN